MAVPPTNVSAVSQVSSRARHADVATWLQRSHRSHRRAHQVGRRRL